MEKKNTSPHSKEESAQKPGSDLLDKFREPALAQDNLPADQRPKGFFELAQQGERVPTVEFILRTGRVFFLHYAYRFNVDLQTNGKLILLATSAQIKITISGRGLDRLARYLVLAQVKWIKESESPLFDDHTTGVFIAGIDISGKGVE